MGSRILANANRNTKIAICCSFMILAAAGAWGCPFASAAGIQTYGQYSATGGIIQDNQYLTTQSTGDIGFLSPGQETITGIMRNGMITVGRSGTKGNTTIDANDHQVYKGDIYSVYKDGGMTWDSAYLEGQRSAIEPKNQPIEVKDSNGNVTGSYNYTPGGTQENTTVAMRPYAERISVNKETIGSSGTYIADKVIEQGSNETTDYVTHNAVAMGNGMFENNVQVDSAVGFIGASENINYITQLKQHEMTTGNYNATSLTTIESFVDVFGTSAISPSQQAVNNAQLGVS